MLGMSWGTLEERWFWASIASITWKESLINWWPSDVSWNITLIGWLCCEETSVYITRIKMEVVKGKVLSNIFKYGFGSHFPSYLQYLAPEAAFAGSLNICEECMVLTGDIVGRRSSPHNPKNSTGTISNSPTYMQLVATLIITWYHKSQWLSTNNKLR